MKQIIYISSAVKKMDDDDLLDILKTSRENNKKNDISGMLLYDNGSFIQVLEGEDSLVDNTFINIQNDERHNNVLVMQSRDLDSREFANWSMGFENISNIDKTKIDGYAQFQSLLYENKFSDSSLAKKILLQFKRF